MKKVNVIIKDELKRELKKFAEQVCIGAATYSRDKLTDIAIESFERFYCDYAPVPGGLYTSYQFQFYRPSGNPKEYDRTYNILRNGIKKYYENKHGKIIRGGVELDIDSLEDNYNYSPAFVFQTIYEEGRHGPVLGIPNMNPTPKELIENGYDNLCDNIDVALDIGVTRAKKETYSYLH